MASEAKAVSVLLAALDVVREKAATARAGLAEAPQWIARQEAWLAECAAAEADLLAALRALAPAEAERVSAQTVGPAAGEFRSIGMSMAAWLAWRGQPKPGEAPPVGPLEPAS